MAFDDVMRAVMRWTTATEALAAVGAQLSLLQSGDGSPEVLAALRAVSETAGLGDLAALDPQQRNTIAAIAGLYLRQSIDLLDHAAAAPGWAYTDPTILDGWGRVSMMVPAAIAAAHSDLHRVESFLDVGTGVGFLAVSAARAWPHASIVGVDVWEPSLARARAHAMEAHVDDRVTFRTQDVRALDDVDAFDCVFVPTFFLSEAAITQSLPALHRATRPGGWIVLGRLSPPPDPLAEAVGRLRTTRAGGVELEATHAVELLQAAGCDDVHVAPKPGPSPLDLVIGRKA
jgi:2-polyprenyl-3-methyl-5-hydroxy-6-metoxy-1,4-benzoquinol methylase